jgi:hypothetical protein
MTAIVPLPLPGAYPDFLCKHRAYIGEKLEIFDGQAIHPEKTSLAGPVP